MMQDYDTALLVTPTCNSRGWQIRIYVSVSYIVTYFNFIFRVYMIRKIIGCVWVRNSSQCFADSPPMGKKQRAFFTIGRRRILVFKINVVPHSGDYDSLPLLRNSKICSIQKFVFNFISDRLEVFYYHSNNFSMVEVE